MAESELTQVFNLLRRAGVRVADGNLNVLDLVFPETGLRRLKVTARPGEPDPGYLTVLRRATPEALEAAMRNGLDVVSLDPPQVIHDGRLLIEPEPVVQLPSATHGKPAWGRWAVLRSLVLAQAPMSQKMLAEISGGSQQAVSQALGHFRNMLVHTNAGYLPMDVKGLVDMWLRDYPGPGGAQTYWYGLDPVTEQVDEAAKLAHELEIEALPTGDAAADKYAPWRLPQVAELFIDEAVDFSVAGFSPADKDTATMVATIPADTTIARVAQWVAAEGIWHERGTEPLADPMIVLWNLLHSEGPDAVEAADVLRTAIETRSLVARD